MNSVYYDYANETFNSSDGQKEETNGSVMINRVPFKNGIIVLMDHPSSLTLYNHVSVEVLSGSVSVFGYEIDPKSPTLNVFSSEKTGLIEIKTETFDRIWKKKTQTADLKVLIHSILENERKTRELLEQFGNSTIAILVRRIAFPVNVQFLELYCPSALQFNLYPKRSFKDYYHVSKSIGKSPVHFGLNEEKLSALINGLIRSATLNDFHSPRIVVCGPRNSGKSSLIRYLINKILSEHTDACHLETDPGQTEFTPPGIVSLTKVNKPIIGPAFYHQKKPVSMVFTGSISPTSPDVYSKSVAKLMQIYLGQFKRIPLLVNTMGWMEGLGLQCLGNVIKIVKPTVLVEIVTEDESSMFDYRDYVPENCHYYQICNSHSSKNAYFSPKETRELSLLSYLGKCQSEFLGPMYLNEIKPYCVSWDKIPIYISQQKVPPYRMIEAITESIVALCAVPESAILESSIPLFPKTLEDEPDNECLGYGLIRAVDEKEHLLYIISPLSMKEWKNVNAIIKGNIMVPDSLILNEDIYETPLPYTDEREVIPQDNTAVEMTDHSMLSLASFSEAESPSLASPSCYRRKIRGRFNRSKN